MYCLGRGSQQFQRYSAISHSWVGWVWGYCLQCSEYVSEDLMSILLMVIWRDVEILIHSLQLTLNFSKWPWDTFIGLITNPCLKEHLLSTTSISDERFRRYELGRTDTTATVCSPEIFSGSMIKCYYAVEPSVR